jgi:serine/threonine-protein kinase
VQGTVEPVGEKLRVQLRLVDGNSGVDLSGQRASFDMPAGDLLAVRDSLAGEAAQLIRKRLGEEIRVREQREGTRDVAAWSLVQRAQGLRKQGETAVKAGDEKGMMGAFHQADSMADQAAGMDQKWAEPLVLRGLLAYRRSYYLGQSDAQQAAPWIDSGLVHIGRALSLQPNNPDGLEVRGSLRYWRWLLQLERDDAKAKALLLDAQNDLEEATRLNPSQAGAWATLSHLYYQTKTGVDVSIAARRALEADAFLDNADKVLERLFLVSYDLGQFTDAAHWCDESSRRFANSPISVQCRLWLLTTKAQEPDVAAAWRYADSLTALSSEQTRAYDRLYNNILVAGVLGRAGLGDSARRVLERSKGDPIVDPQGDLAFVAAFAYVLIGDKEKAIDRLKTYLASSPGRREAFKDDTGWWFRDLQNDPAYQRLMGIGH